MTMISSQLTNLATCSIVFAVLDIVGKWIIMQHQENGGRMCDAVECRGRWYV
jgi:hypothetical protein